MNIYFKGIYIGQGKADLVLSRGSESFVVELKAIAKINENAVNQLKNYMLQLGVTQGCVVNFGPSQLTMQAVEVEKTTFGNVNQKRQNAPAVCYPQVQDLPA